MTVQIDHKYIGMISTQLLQFKRKGERLYNFRCPFCGDSQKNKFKARGYMFEHKGSLFFKCHNCDISASTYKLLEHIDPSLARAYSLETFSDRRTANTAADEFIIRSSEPAVEKKETVDINLPKITKLLDSHRAVQYLKSRKISEEYYGDLYYCKNMKEMEYLNKLYKDRLIAEQRIIIPFRDRDGSLIGVTGRAMGNSNLRYVTIRADEKKPLVYGMDRVDFTRKIYVVEGQFDSMFIDNCIAPGGTDFNRAVYTLPQEQVVLILDNQPRNKQVVKKVESFCQKGYSLTIWPSNWRFKDINDAIVSGMTKQEIIDLINTNTHQGLSLKLAIRDWKKC